MDTGGQAQFSPEGIVLFERSVLVPASVEELFRFHENPENIVKIAPASLRVESVDCERTARVGGIFRIRASQFGLPIRWTGMWERVDSPRALVDTAIHSPFAFWRHSHLFEPEGDGCRMTDRVEFLLKGGWAGGVVSRFVMPFVFAGIFRARHAATVRWFSKSSPESRNPSGG
jgi:ligand-binding SRPBCC domain-containing protein